MRKNIGLALLGAGLVLAAGSAEALQVVVTGVDKNSDGTSTYHFSVKVDQGESLLPNLDFVTVYNFAGLVGAPKTPPGWVFSSEDYGRTPTWGGYPAVLPVDVPGLSNLTWTTKRPYPPGTEIDGFAATTKATATTDGEYTAQSVREQPMIGGTGKREAKQAVIGELPAPAFLAP
jgi:hypothetical protein